MRASLKPVEGLTSGGLNFPGASTQGPQEWGPLHGGLKSPQRPQHRGLNNSVLNPPPASTAEAPWSHPGGLNMGGLNRRALKSQNHVRGHEQSC